MENWITSFMEQFGYFGIFLLITLENLFPPIPSEVILTFGGFMTTQSAMTIIGVITVSTVGSVFGAAILYGVGLLINVDKLELFITKWGHILRLTNKDIQRADAWFDKYGPWTVFFCRFIPLIRSLISIPAGMSKMDFTMFIILTTLGTLIWNTVLVNVGAAVGASWETIVGYMEIYSNLVYVGFIIGLGLFIWLMLRRNKR